MNSSMNVTIRLSRDDGEWVRIRADIGDRTIASVIRRAIKHYRAAVEKGEERDD